MKHLKLFASHSQFIEPTDKPAVSYCEQENEVHYHPDPFNGHEYVDLGLPSGTLWAKCNVGATNETDYGLYFAWGETQGYTASQVGTDKNFSAEDYKFGDGEASTPSNMIKYNSTDGLTTLELIDDAARINMRGEWHIPTKTQLQELLSNTTNEWTTVNGVNGYKFTSTNNNTKYIFFPAAGRGDNGSVTAINEYGFISSSLIGNSASSIWSLMFTSSTLQVLGYQGRTAGISVRGVVTPTKNLITFTVDSTSYQAEEGMTWQQWVNSGYNVVANPYTGEGTINNGKWYAESDRVRRSESDMYLLQIKYSDSFVLPNDLIDAGKSYITARALAPSDDF